MLLIRSAKFSINQLLYFDSVDHITQATPTVGVDLIADQLDISVELPPPLVQAMANVTSEEPRPEIIAASIGTMFDVGMGSAAKIIMGS